MTPYKEIFGVSMVINVIVTLASSGYGGNCLRMIPCFGSYQAVSTMDADSVDDQESKPLAKDEEEGESNKELNPKDEVSIHRNLLFRYLCVYLLATSSDWFQGPYVYALYSAYGFSQHDIAVLFVAGFGSSMIFGSFIGGMADNGGRRKYVVIFAIVYALSCITKHFKNYWILMIGRLLGGVATSLLFSVFDSWLIKAHAEEKISKSFIAKSFSAASYGNSSVAILTGLVANKIASMTEMVPYGMSKNDSMFHIGGYLYPFDAAIITLIFCGLLAQFTWKENYGSVNKEEKNHSSTPSFVYTLTNALTVTMRNPEILLCGIISSLFEGSMYVFVFMWTPMLTNLTVDTDEGLPFGLIFSTFMVCCMIGSSLFSIIIEKVRVEKLGIYVFLLGSLSMSIIFMSNSDTQSFIGMNVFELCVGMYFPIMGTLKSAIVPESQRAAIYNLYRVPLNFIVLTSLLTDLTPKQSFLVTTVMLGIAFLLQVKLLHARSISSV